MATRTTRSTVNFRAPFTVRGINDPQSPGTYEIETDEEIIEGNDRTIYRRIATLPFIRNGGSTEIWTIDPEDLNAALAKDGL
jgi:hypothetical protein